MIRTTNLSPPPSAKLVRRVARKVKMNFFRNHHNYRKKRKRKKKKVMRDIVQHIIIQPKIPTPVIVKPRKDKCRTNILIRIKLLILLVLTLEH